MNNKIKRIIITPGEPAGIGPDIVMVLAQQEWPVELIICADLELLKIRSSHLPLKFCSYSESNAPRLHPINELTVLDIAVFTPVNGGKLNVINSKYVLKTLSRACDGCLKGEFAGLVTGPVHKGIINESGISFIGQTEFLAERSNCKPVVMMLVNDQMRIALATTHLPLSEVSKTISNAYLIKVIIIIEKYLRKYFNIINPCIYVCGLNPHAGEDGYIGKEEINIIIPSLNFLRNKGYNIIGPLAADTLFQQKYLRNADAILTMYHDQGLPVLKYGYFGKSVNITLGLPFIRTSVDHGTALELVNTNKKNKLIKYDSIKQAVNLAINIISNK